MRALPADEMWGCNDDGKNEDIGDGEMRKLLLTSDGFENIEISKVFLKLVGKSVGDIKILFIPTASRTREELIYVEKSRKELLSIGVNEENIIVYNLDREINDGLGEFDVVYVCGGNTFYLLYKVKEVGFGEKIKQMVADGVVYVGVSAGSILVGPDIEICSRHEDRNDVRLEDLAGLGLTDKILSPHYVDEEEGIVEKFKKETGNKVTRLRDGEALLINGDVEEVIG